VIVVLKLWIIFIRRRINKETDEKEMKEENVAKLYIYKEIKEQP
jgi:hypothetical protein